MKPYITLRIPVTGLLFVVPLTGLLIIILLAISDNHELNSMPDHSEMSVHDVIVTESNVHSASQTVPVPLFKQVTSIDDGTAVEETIDNNEAITNDHATSMPIQQPSLQQFEDQALLEKRIDGMIYVEGPLIPAILQSHEYASLTEEQRARISNRIVTRLNNGELRPQDAFPGWPEDG